MNTISDWSVVVVKAACEFLCVKTASIYGIENKDGNKYVDT